MLGDLIQWVHFFIGYTHLKLIIENKKTREKQSLVGLTHRFGRVSFNNLTKMFGETYLAALTKSRVRKTAESLNRLSIGIELLVFN